MFEKTKAFSGFAVDDLQAAKRFYGETLGLQVTEDNELLNLHIAGGGVILVYPKPNHTPATFTWTRPSMSFPRGACSSSGTRSSIRTTRASRVETGPASPGSRTRPATSCPSSRGRRQRETDGPQR